MAAPPLILSAIAGGAQQPWHHARKETERHELIRRLLGGPDAHLLFYAWDRPAGENDQFPPHQLKVVFKAGFGLAHFSNTEVAVGAVGAWLARTDEPPAEPPEVVYDPWDPERISVPDNALLSLDRLAAIAEEYAATGRQPSGPAGVDWMPVEWV